MFDRHLPLRLFSIPFSPQVGCRSRLRLALTSHSSILATDSEGEGSTKTGMSMEEVREEITATADIPPPPQLSTLSRVTDVAIDDPSQRSLGTEHIGQRPPDAIVGEHSAVSHAPSSDVEVPSSPTPVLGNFLPIGTLLPFNSAVALSEHTLLSPEPYSQMPAPAASGPSRPWDPSAAVEGDESAKAALCQERGKDEPHDDITVTLDAPTRLLPPQPIVDAAITGVSRTHSQSSLYTSKYPPLAHGQYDIV